jgi:hypothetical protein
MQRRLYRFPCQWWRYAILLMGYYCRKLERAFRHLPQRRTLRCHVLLQGRADKETLRAVCRLSWRRLHRNLWFPDKGMEDVYVLRTVCRDFTGTI